VTQPQDSQALREARRAIRQAIESDANVLHITGAVPPEIVAAQGITDLRLASSEPLVLPPDIGEMRGLRSLDLSEAKLAPGTLSTLAPLTELRALNLSFKDEPDLGWLKGHHELEWLELLACDFDQLPQVVCTLPSLRYLGLGANQIADLPADFANLRQLEQLWYWGNDLSRVPDALAGLSSLQMLRLDDNRLGRLPSWLGQLKALNFLAISENPLGSALGGLADLGSLETLHAVGVDWIELPPQIRALTKLRELDISKNPIGRLPDWLSELRNLKEVQAEDCQLAEIEALAALPELTSLNVDENPLKSLPAAEGAFPQLRRLIMSNVESLAIPPEIIADQDAPAILRLARQLATSDRRPLNEAKVILVGQGGVGKTSIARALVGLPFDHREQKTEGIDIRAWPIEAGGTNVRLNMWDFGGQEIMHATHQFFLTKRSLYLLVIDSRISEEQNRVDYWLKLIQSFAPDSPIIIVGNKSDEHQLDIDRHRLRSKYPNIAAIVETSCTHDQEGIAQLRDEIRREVARLPHVHDQLLASWFSVKADLEQLEDDYITYEAYQEMCVRHHIADEQGQATLIGFLHDLGVVINFRSDPRLRDTNILNPEWVTDGVYGILNSNLLFQNRGILDRADLEQILDSKRFPAAKHMFIVDMMRRFELCFDFEGYPDQRFLVPDLLPRDEPSTGDWSDALSVEYQYDVLPNSVISRFIVRMHRHIDRRTYWRTGVVLRRQRARALVRADIAEARVQVMVVGDVNHRRDLLTVIRSELESIHESIPGLTPEEHVKIPGTRSIVSYQHLLDLEQMGEETFVPVGLTERVSVGRLLSGVEPRAARSPVEAGNRSAASDSSRDVRSPGSPTVPPAPRPSPWSSGMFYLVTVMVVLAVAVVALKIVPWYLVGPAFIFTLLVVLAIGVLQLRNDDRLGEETFGGVVKELVRSARLLGSARSEADEADEAEAVRE
jgi:internalin A